MRIINNIPLKNLEKASASETTPSLRPMQKLAELLGSQTGQNIQLEALLQSKQGNLATLLISNLGQVDLPLKDGTDLPEGIPVRATISYENGSLKADLKPILEEGQPATGSRNTDKLLTQLGLPLTKANKEAVSLLIQYKVEPSAEHIKQLAEGSFLASKISELSSSLPVEELLLNEAQTDVDWNLPLKKIAVDLMEASKAVKTTQTIDLPEVDKSQGSPKQNDKGIEKPTLLKEAGKGETSISVNREVNSEVAPDLNANDLIESTQEGKNESKSIQTSKGQVLEAKELLNQLDSRKILSLMVLGESLDLEPLKRLKGTFDTEAGQIHLKHKLFTSLLEGEGVLKLSTDFKMALEEWQRDSGNKLDTRAINSLTELLNRFEPEFLEGIREQLEVYQKSSAMVEALPSQVVGLHIPLMLNDSESQLELYVQKRNGRQSADSFKMLVALNTEHFDQVQILITDTTQQLELIFRLKDEKYLENFDDEIKAFEGELREMMDKPVFVKTALRFEEPTVLTLTSFMGSDVAAQIDVRV